jgi:hypothetical protein
LSSLRQPGRRFAILAAPRTGSNMLCTLLGSHPEILCHHEIFNPEAIYYALDYRDGRLNIGTMAERERAPLEFLDRVWHADLGYPCLGFKFCRGQNPQVFVALLADRGVRKIVIKRDNRLKTFVSELMSRQTGQWEVYNRADLVGERAPVHVDIAELRANIALNDAYYSRIEITLRRSDQDFLPVTYETLFSEQPRRQLLEFLGVSPRLDVLRVRSVKQNACDLRRLVANFDELEVALRGSDLAQELCSIGN